MGRKEQLALGTAWFEKQGWKPFPFQVKTWKAYLQGKNGMVNAATGSGKTYALLMPIMLEFVARHRHKDEYPADNGLQAIWISPIKALTVEIQAAAQRLVKDLNLGWRVAVRTGDTPAGERTKQKKSPPEILITTPESLHLLLGSPNYKEVFSGLKVLVADEWHELIGSKRGVQVELALSHLRHLIPGLRTWGISATIGNMEEAAAVLFGAEYDAGNWELIRADIRKKIDVQTIIPKDIKKFPWAGNLGTVLVEQVLEIINASRTTLLFTNTRRQCERWYQTIIDHDPELIGLTAMHHSAIDQKQRLWVEQAIHDEKLKVVVCTSGLDLGVDFRPVDTVIQIGSPKGVARFLQRAGRSGHQPNATSRIHLVPTHAFELIEAAALRQAIIDEKLESRIPYRRSFDVLVQYLVTLSVSGGFDADVIYEEVRQTFAFADITPAEWEWCLDFICTGGSSLRAYDEYQRVGLYKGKYYIVNQAVAARHRMGIGTIVSDSMMQLKYRNGAKIGNIEERFISSLKKGDVFVFGGKKLEVVMIRNMEVRVKKSKKKNFITPSWSGGRMPLSNQLSSGIRAQLTLVQEGKFLTRELEAVKTLTDIQADRSHVPTEQELLVEYFQDREGYHLVFYPFDGRFIHEGLSSLIAWRISQQQPISFSIAVNDYGFELLTDQPLDPSALLDPAIFSTESLWEDIRHSANATEMAKRKFRDIASISGLVFQGFPGSRKSDRHLQASAQMIYQVFKDHDPDNLLLQQANEEVLRFQLEETRLQAALRRIQGQELIIREPKRPTPFAFPLIVSRLRARVSSETLKDRIQKMKLKLIRP
ncbi:ligase-associated DNA damage response DEXH box helicase [Neolewinella aurantiaca]|uniref:Ligase-associated DNA damage response DEXH box helicase n=2 Tax=Neolewinella aurantiaca TaxID=2602767 RepID=A0A5C7FT74_9BACT|nr:ligase-associated DNA damage response DEXH box helicase [Neolewinella aurantiaca]